MSVEKKNAVMFEQTKKSVKRIKDKAIEFGNILGEDFTAYFKSERINVIIDDYYRTRDILNTSLNVVENALIKLENNMGEEDEDIVKKIRVLTELNMSLIELADNLATLHDNYDKVIHNVLDGEEEELEPVGEDEDDDNEDDEDDGRLALYSSSSSKPKKEENKKTNKKVARLIRKKKAREAR